MSRILLRFRDEVADPSGRKVSGIAEHQAIIIQRGHVLWGWWKRYDEPDRAQWLMTLPPPFWVDLVSLSEKRQFKAYVTKVEVGHDIDPTLVPPYYRDQLSHIHVWFRLGVIESQVFDESLITRIGVANATLFDTEQTIANAGSQGVISSSAVRWTTINASSTHILHISDLHLGEDHNFLGANEVPVTSVEAGQMSRRITLLQAIEADLQRLGIPSIAAVVVSGDIVTKCKWQLDVVAKFFESLLRTFSLRSEQVMVVPGNHDFYRQDAPPPQALLNYEHEKDFKLFRAQVFSTPPLDAIECGVDIICSSLPYRISFGLLNSARWTAFDGFSEYGFIGKERYKPVLTELSRRSDAVRALVLHHHLVPIEPMVQPGMHPSRPASLTLDAAEILGDAQAAGVTLVLHGHQHRPDIAKISRLRHGIGAAEALDEEITIVAGGSAGSNQLAPHVRNTYTLLSFSATSVRCLIREIDPEDRADGTFAQVDRPIRARSA